MARSTSEVDLVPPAGFWDKVRANLHRIPFLEDAIAAYYCAVDPATPVAVKAALVGALAYFVLPFDVVPDFLLAVGFTDDAAVIAGVVATMRKYMTIEHYGRAKEWIRNAQQRAGP
ncbi:MAG: DUF1232 domain-containing protein [Alphaproteobacteria bacterium]|nr:DUF1232 domain-containing protein [Alphaproteobacteria bacterium]